MNGQYAADDDDRDGGGSAAVISRRKNQNHLRSMIVHSTTDFVAASHWRIPEVGSVRSVHLSRVHG